MLTVHTFRHYYKGYFDMIRAMANACRYVIFQTLVFYHYIIIDLAPGISIVNGTATHGLVYGMVRDRPQLSKIDKRTSLFGPPLLLEKN